MLKKSKKSRKIRKKANFSIKFEVLKFFLFFKNFWAEKKLIFKKNFEIFEKIEKKMKF